MVLMSSFRSLPKFKTTISLFWGFSAWMFMVSLKCLLLIGRRYCRFSGILTLLQRHKLFSDGFKHSIIRHIYGNVAHI